MTQKRPEIRVYSERDLIRNQGRKVPERAIQQETDIKKKTTRTIEEFEFQEIDAHRRVAYDDKRARYGSLSTTDVDRAEPAQRERRFELSPILRSSLSVDQEETRVIEEKVRARVSALQDEAIANAASEGYGAGLKKGRDEAYQEFKSECESRAAAIESLVSEFEGLKDRIYQANEKFILSLIFEVAQGVILRELSTDKAYVERLVQSLIQTVSARSRIKIQIHPKDVETLDIIKNGLSQKFSELKQVSIEASDAVRVGGCLIETEHHFIDASVQTQLDQLKSALVGEAG